MNSRRCRLLILLWVVVPIGAACRDEAYVKLEKLEFPHKSTLQNLNPEQDKLFRKSVTLWKAVQDNAVLSWEAIATARLVGGPASPTEGRIGGFSDPVRIAACDNRNADTGKPFSPNLVSISWREGLGLADSLQQCFLPAFPPGEYPYEGLINPVAYSRCMAAPSPCHPIPFNFPWCAPHCVVAANDDSLFAFAYPAGLGGAPSSGRVTVSPAFRNVEAIRALGRSMSFDHRNPGADWDVWTWRVLELAHGSEFGLPDGSLFENFSPTLFVSKVRAFLPAPARGDPEAKRYLILYRVEIVDGPECAPGTADPTQITAQDCPSLVSFTPAYNNQRSEDIGRVVTWQLTLRPGDAGNEGIDEHSPVYIEFTLGNGLNRTAGPALQPTSIDLGSRPVGTTIDVGRALVLDNSLAGGKWTLEGIDLIGPEAAVFEVDIAGAAPGRRDLWPGASLPVGIHVHTQSPGTKTAAIVFRLKNPDGAPFAVSAPIAVRLLPLATLDLMPDRLFFATNSAQPLPWRKRFLIVNNGSLPLLRQGVLLIGADFLQFRVFAEDGMSPPPARAQIDPGQSETFVVEYCPRESNRDHHAEVHIYASNGGMTGRPTEGTLPLEGYSPPSVGAVCFQPRPAGVPQ